MRAKGLREAAAGLPGRPGVYLFKDARGRTLYGGKALSLRDRVRSYFSGEPVEERTRRMLALAADLETIEAASEVDALLLESRLVKDLKPRYNVMLKDDKSYPWLMLSEGEDFPRVEITREPQQRGRRYYGPFMDAGGLRRSLQVLQGAFQFRTCALDIRADDPKRRHVRPCLLYHIRRCTAPCADLVSREAYREQMEGLKRVLAGDKAGLLADLKRRMAASSERLHYEKAAELRDQIRALESLDKRGRFSDRPDDLVGPLTPSDGLEELRELLGLPHPLRRIEGVDIALLQGQDAVGAVVAFEDGIPFKDRYRRYRIKTVSGTNDTAMIREVVSRRFRRAAEGEDWIPQALLIDGGKGQYGAASAALEEAGGSGVCLVALAKREERLFTPAHPDGILLPRRSGALRVCQFVRDEAHRFAGRYHHLLRRRRLLGGKVAP